MYLLGTEWLSIHQLQSILTEKISLSEEANSNIQKCRDFLDEKIKDDSKIYYGINTGFGSLCNVKISSGDIEQLQNNLVLSHACGVGEEVPLEIVKIMLLLKIKRLKMLPQIVRGTT